MLSRRNFLGIVAFSVSLSANPLFAQDKKKGKAAEKPRSGPAGDRDGKDNVRGAVWEVTAKNVKTNKQEVFRFRHQTGVAFDFDGKKIGAVSPVGNTKDGGVKSRLVLRESTPIIGEMVMTQTKVGVWGGVLKTKEGDEWNCVIRVLDR